MVETARSSLRTGAQRRSFALLFSYGFRPFFLGASAYAALAMALWLAWIGIHAANASLTWISISGAPHVWHAHEMVFGFGVAAVAGFLLTAVPNWTGALPVSGWPLALLFSMWVAGRIAMLTSALVPPFVTAAADLAFVPFLALQVAHQLFVRPQGKNIVFLALLAFLFIANGAYHLALAGVVAIDPASGIRAGLLALVAMVAIIGGRIVPSFTHNHLKRSATDARLPVRLDWLDRISLVSVMAFAIAAALRQPDLVTGTLALLAALTNFARLSLWRGLATIDAPIVLVLHVGYAWLVIGFFMWAMADLIGIFSEVAALHALSTGGIGTMVLAVMSRASLGHTGRPLVAPRPIVAAYVLVSVAAALRAFGPVVLPQAYYEIMLVAGLAWLAAFTLFTLVYFPILTAARVGPG